jgi:NTE family protein
MESTTCLVLSGGIALGAYEGGAYEALHERRELWPRSIAGSSVGAVNGAIIAGTPPRERVRALREFWRGNQSDLWWPGARWVAEAPAAFRRAYRWGLALQTRVVGCPSVMRPRGVEAALGMGLGVYDLSPLRARLTKIIDFERLNRGEVRLAVMTTDLETVETVVFDTGRGDVIGPEHLIASCGLVPEFQPMEVGGRLLGDGGLAANAPLEAVLEEDGLEDGALCFVVDLFDSTGERPRTLAQSASRALDLFYGNQTDRLLRAHGADGASGTVVGERTRVVPVRYRMRPEEPGPHRLFDFSTVALNERWAAGSSDMTEAIGRLSHELAA